MPVVTVEALRDYVRAPEGQDAEYLASCLAEGAAMIAAYCEGQDVPEDAQNRAVLEVAADLFHRRQAPSGVSQYATPDGAPVRIARDPMLSAYPILNRFMAGGFS